MLGCHQRLNKLNKKNQWLRIISLSEKIITWISCFECIWTQGADENSNIKITNLLKKKKNLTRQHKTENLRRTQKMKTWMTLKKAKCTDIKWETTCFNRKLMARETGNTWWMKLRWVGGAGAELWQLDASLEAERVYHISHLV